MPTPAGPIVPPTAWRLFTLRQLQLYTDQLGLTAEEGELAHDLIASDIRLAVGAARYDALTDYSVFRSVALEVARRRGTNPRGLRSEAIDDYTVTYASETIGPSLLTAGEVALVRKAAGIRGGGAFSITPAAPAPVPCWPRRRVYP